MAIKMGVSWRVSAAFGLSLGVAALGALTGVSGCGASQSHVAEAPEALREVQQARWLAGPDGMHVELLDFADDSALVRVLGVDSELTGKVLAYERGLNGERLEYRTKWHGDDQYTVAKERDGRWRAYVPGFRDGFDLTYDEAKSRAVDATVLQREHQAQKKSGQLDALQRFDRAAAQKHSEDELAAEVARTQQQCGKAPPVSIVWSSVSDQQLLDKSVSGYCASLLSALNHLCDTQAGKRFVSEKLESAQCKLDGDNSLKLEAGKLHWSINFDITNADQAAYATLLALTPEGSALTLRQQIEREQTAVCADANQTHVVLVGPREAPHRGLAYGDGKQFWWVRAPESMSAGWFFDPRQRNDKHNGDFRGLDLRLFSYVEPDPKTRSCKLTCGTRETALKLLEGESKTAVLDAARYQPSPHQREPYALARDKAGVYYFVDRGVSEAGARDFRLYRGPRGKLKPLLMKDVVADSEGEIFASSSGKLRLVLGKQTAQWIAGGTANLLVLPLSENYGLIYNELGVYLREKLGVPCDDF